MVGTPAGVGSHDTCVTRQAGRQVHQSVLWWLGAAVALERDTIQGDSLSLLLHWLYSVGRGYPLQCLQKDTKISSLAYTDDLCASTGDPRNLYTRAEEIADGGVALWEQLPPEHSSQPK